MPIDASQIKWDESPQIDASQVKWDAPTLEKPNLNWSDVPGKSITSIPKDAFNIASGMWNAVRHPIDTVSNVSHAAGGALHNILPKSITSSYDNSENVSEREKESIKKSVGIADAVGETYKPYGSMEGIKQKIANEPLSVAMDLSTVLGGGATLASKIPQAEKIAQALRTTSEYTNPINAVTSTASKVIPLAGKGIANLVGGLGTHTGGESLQQAAKAGFRGGEAEESFINNMRDKVPKTDVLDIARQNVEEMGRAKSEAYRNGMAKVSNDKTILNFDEIDKTIQSVSDQVSFKGQIKNEKAAQVGQKITEEIERWKNLDPKEFHTPEGLDALKQRIGGIVESIPFEEKTARMVGTKVYNSIKSEIVKQAPVYADTMKGYSEASDLVREIERSLSLGQKASADTSMRKLQSIMRNNVNTNYGNRIDMMKKLEEQGGHEVMPALAGQALNSWTPRGLGGAVAGGLGMGGYALGGPGLAIPTLAAQSPRLMGEAALKTGQLARVLKKLPDTAERLGIDPTTLANILYQSGRTNQ